MSTSSLLSVLGSSMLTICIVDTHLGLGFGIAHACSQYRRLAFRLSVTFPPILCEIFWHVRVYNRSVVMSLYVIGLLACQWFQDNACAHITKPHTSHPAPPHPHTPHCAPRAAHARTGERRRRSSHCCSRTSASGSAGSTLSPTPSGPSRSHPRTPNSKPGARTPILKH
jgi:hypothetical protein